jgi:hypothetical protein
MHPRYSSIAAVFAAAVSLNAGTNASAQGFLELEQTPHFVGQGLAWRPTIAARTTQRQALPPTSGTPLVDRSATSSSSPTN